MRPLETKVQREARERRNKTLLGLFIAAIMIFSVVGYALWQRQPIEKENVRQYNNHTFIKGEQGWQTELAVEGKKIALSTLYLPEELENITVEGKPLLADFKDKTLYLVANDTNERQAAAELGLALEPFVQRMQLACSEQEANSSFCLENNLPIKSCDDADFQTVIVIIEEQEDEEAASIGFKEGCLTIWGRDSELLMAAEKALFMIFGIVK